MLNDTKASVPLPLAVRLLITLGVPAVCLYAAQWLLLPGVSRDFVEVSGAASSVSVFALGVMPVISTYVFVEIVAFFVPRWSRLRHDPAGRARIDRVIGPTVIGLSVVQAHGVALYLSNIADDFDPGMLEISRPFVVFCLVGGVCVYWLVARWITRHGLINGVLALSMADMLRDEYVETAKTFGLDWPGAGPFVEPVPHDLDVQMVGLSCRHFAHDLQSQRRERLRIEALGAFEVFDGQGDVVDHKVQLGHATSISRLPPSPSWLHAIDEAMASTSSPDALYQRVLRT